MHENTAMVIIVIGALIAVVAILSVGMSNDTKEKLACYEAAKINTNINCDK